jgi:hypothetical protein
MTALTSREVEKKIGAFIAKFAPKNRAVIRAARRVLKRQFPTAFELVYDNYNFFVIGFGPSIRPSEVIISLAAAANGVGLCFLRGAALPDPDGVLQGSGKQTRFVRLPSAATLRQPAIQALLRQAVARSKVPMPDTKPAAAIIRSISSKQRPRR